MTLPPAGVLDEVLDQIAAAPQSAAALTLYALVSTLEFERAGYLFKLAKLRDLSPDQRVLAYRLIDAVLAGAIDRAAWTSAKQAMDARVRGT